MKWNDRILAIVIFFLLSLSPLRAQDALPGCPLLAESITDNDTLFRYNQRTDTVSIPLVTLPKAFRQLGKSELIDSIGILKPF